MNVNRLTQVIVAVFFLISLSPATEAVQWNGYIQTRFHSDWSEQSSFQTRRAKLWLKGPLPSWPRVQFKFQAVYRSHKDNSFLVQDVYSEFSAQNWRFKVGRFVPDFTLEWNQPDATIPLLERGKVIQALMHGEKSTARQIGLQAAYEAKHWYGSVGIFNAEQDVPGENLNSNFLHTGRAGVHLPGPPGTRIHLGGSIAYRYLNGSTLKKLFPADKPVNGNDFRYGLEMLLQSQLVDFQAEWLRGDIAGHTVSGAYLFLNVHPPPLGTGSLCRLAERCHPHDQ